MLCDGCLTRKYIVSCLGTLGFDSCCDSQIPPHHRKYFLENCPCHICFLKPVCNDPCEDYKSNVEYSITGKYL
jgi:hypothetical protein